MTINAPPSDSLSIVVTLSKVYETYSNEYVSFFVYLCTVDYDERDETKYSYLSIHCFGIL